MSEELIQQALDSLALSGPLASGDGRYVDVDPVRGLPMTRIRRSLRAADFHRQSVRFALAGQRGSGKSTELMQFAASLDPQRVLHVSLSRLLGENPLTASALPLACLAGMDHRLGRYPPSWTGEIIRNGLALMDDFRARVRVVPQGTGQSALGTAALQLLSTDSHPDSRDWLDGHRIDVFALANDLLKGFRERDGHDMVLIIDDLDKYRVDEVAKLLCGERAEISYLSCHALFTIPLDLAWHDRLNDDFSVVATTAVEVFNHEGTQVNQEAVGLLRTLVHRRVPHELFVDGEETVAELIRASGGSLADLLFILEECLLRAHGGIRSRDVQYAKAKLASKLRASIRPSHSAAVAQLSQEGPLQLDGPVRDLITSGCVLVYDLNGWVAIHPVLRAERAPRRQVLPAVPP